MQHGVEAATIEQIREASGASSGSIYHHFGSKQAIAVALYLDGMEELAVLLRDAMREQDDLRVGIRTVLVRYFHWVSEHRDWALYLLRVATADLGQDEADAIDEINRRTRDDLAQWLRPYVERKEIVHLPDELYASLIFGAATHYARHWLVGRLTLDLDFVVESLAQATWSSLRAPASSAGSEASLTRSSRTATPNSTIRTPRSKKGGSK